MDYNISYRKKDKRIQCIISYKDNDGKWKQKSKQGFARQKDAKPWIKDTVEKLEETIKTPSEFRGVTFGEFKKVFLKDKKRRSQNTILSYKRAFKHFKELDSILLVELGYINIKPCIDKMVDGGYKKSTIEKHIAHVAAMLSHAKDSYKIIDVVPINKKHYELPKEEKNKKINALNKDELSDLLSKLDGEDYMISLIASKCGLRIGEIIGLTDSSFNFKKSEIKVDKQWKIIDDKRNYGFGDLKTGNSYRVVPIPSRYTGEIKSYVKSCVIGIDRRVFTDARTADASSRLWRKYRRKGHEASIHDLRHTYATTLLFNGLDYKTVAEFMGDTVTTIIKTYSHFIEDMYQDAKNRIDNIL